MDDLGRSFQFVLRDFRIQKDYASKGRDQTFLNSTLAIPLGVALSSISLQIVHGFVNIIKLKKHRHDGPSQREDVDPATFYYLTHDSKESVGWTIFGFNVARLVGCLALFALSTKTLLSCLFHSQRLTSKPTHSFRDCPEIAITLTFLYSSLLAIVAMSVKKWTRLAIRYNNTVILSTLAVYIYRDIWPLGTYTKQPQDTARDGLLWYKSGLLFFTGAIVPLFVPRRYIPVDPQNPSPVPNPELTSSIISYIYYSYVDPVIFKGYRVEHPEVDVLPPLCDTDEAKVLVQRGFPHLDPYQGASKRHLFFGMMQVFRGEYTVMALCLLVKVAAELCSPIGINRVLYYLETGGKDAYVRPWVWICLMFIGPAISSLSYNAYIFAASHALVRAEALITELVFEHSLRIRLVAEPSKESKAVKIQDSLTVVGTPDTASVAETSGSCSDDSNTNLTSMTASSSKGKAKQPPRSPPLKASPAPKPNDLKADPNLIGKINNLITTDLGNITRARDFLMLVLSVPVQVIVCTIFLYQILGWSAFVGLAFTVVLLPIPGYITRMLQSVQKQKMRMTDSRVQEVTEVVGVLRMIKLFGWESKMSKRIEEKREAELAASWKYKVLSSLNNASNSTIPTITMVATYATYTLVMKESLTPSIIFSSVAIFNILRVQLFQVSWEISNSIQGKVSLDRISDFLRKTELLDVFLEPEFNAIRHAAEPLYDESDIGFNNATFSWTLDVQDGIATPSRRAYKLRIDNELLFKHDHINLIIGPTGCGKTSLLMALLGEMHFNRTSPDSWFNLPRDEGVAYAAQESWVQNATIRDNILFGSPYNETRYKKVLYQCGLEEDLEVFDAGDATEVGEKGIRLSGGQKARVTLARAIYSRARIILLDDVLAALDVHTSTWIINKCFKGDLVQGRTILLVTHNVPLVTPIAQFIVSIGQDGTVKSQGANTEVPLTEDPALAAEEKFILEQTEIENEAVEALGKKEVPRQGKLVPAEEIARGHVTWKAIKLFLSGLGGDYPFVFYTLWIAGSMGTDWVRTFQTWFLGYWGSQYENNDSSEVRVPVYLSLYSVIVLLAVVLNMCSYFFYVSGSMKASRVINKALVNSVLTSTFRWLDKTPTARIIARCTQDISVVDGPIADTTMYLTNAAIEMITNVGVIVIFIPLFVFPGILIAALGFYLGNIYMKVQLSVKRELSNAKSPLLAHFSAAISGIVSVRAYGAQAAFKAESLKRIDHYSRIKRAAYSLNRWISVRIDLLGQIFTVALASYLVYGHSIGASNTGFTLNLAVDFCSVILWWVRIFNEFEVQSNSLERIQDYIDIEHEPQLVEEGEPPAAWPTSGQLVIDNLSARYSTTGPTVLHNLSFQIESGQRVGVVGRTGSGKSTLTLALLRGIVTEGTVYYDGIDTNKLNLEALRSNITIIPQTPELISGSLRKNLDPFEQHDDASLNDALRSAGLFSLQDKGEDRLTLDSNVSAGGSNFSVGEKQIIALARAMVRGSKLLILDEATSAIDYKTDSLIQETLRHKLPSDVTVITVAHRLQTIMDADKIMVLKEGQIVEFDHPKVLFQKKGSLFKALVDESGDREQLYSMAAEKLASSFRQS